MTQRKMNNEYDRPTHRKGNIKVNKHCKMSSHSNKQIEINVCHFIFILLAET